MTALAVKKNYSHDVSTDSEMEMDEDYNAYEEILEDIDTLKKVKAGYTNAFGVLAKKIY